MKYTKFTKCTAALSICLIMLLSGITYAAEPVVQPTTIPGEYSVGAQPFPAAASIIARPAQTLPVYGLYTWGYEYMQNRENIKNVGWRSVRLAGTITDEYMTALAQDGMEVMVTAEMSVMTPGLSISRNDYASDEVYIQTYVAEIQKLLTRYGPNGTFFSENPTVPYRPILFVEILNEPNFHYMIRDREPRPEVEAEREALYAKVLTAAYKAVKASWSEVSVIGFAAGGASAGDVRFFQNVLKKDADIIKNFDIWSTHPYITPVSPGANKIEGWGRYSIASTMQTNREMMKKVADKPVWFTEIGWQISQADGGRYNIWDTPVPPLLQAAYVTEMYAIAMRLGVERTHIMFATDTDGFNGGFFLQDKSWRPSAYAVQNMISLMPNPKLTGVIHDGADGTYAYKFLADTTDASANDVTMVWNVGGAKTITLPWGEPTALVYDMLGSEQVITATGGNITLDIGACPMYVTANDNPFVTSLIFENSCYTAEVSGAMSGANTADAILVVYQGTCPMYVAKQTISNSNPAVTLNIPVDGDTYNAKLFVWDSINTMRPLIKPVVLD